MGYLRNVFCLVHPSPEVFGRSQWLSSQVLYIYYRYLFAFYVIGWDVLITITGSYQYGGWYQIDLKAWAFHLLALYSLVAVASSLVHWVRLSKWRYESFVNKDTRSTVDNNVVSTSQSTLGLGSGNSIYRSTPWYFKVDWLLFNINLSINPLVTILYWISVIDRDVISGMDTLEKLVIVHLTIANTCLVLIDLFMRRIPVRVLHVVYPMVFWVIFIVVNVIVHVTIETGPSRPGSFIYREIFNWSAESPSSAIGFALAFTFGVFVVHMIAFSIFKFRNGLFRRCCKEVGYEDNTSDVNFEMSSGLCCSACGRGRRSHDLVFT